jgi:hypothetical protein
MSLVPAPIHAHLSWMTLNTPSEQDAKLRTTWLRVVLWASILVICVVAVHFFGSWAINFISELNKISGTMSMVGLLAVCLVVYAVLIATPFMPGIEVGIALLLLQGSSVAPFVYLATVVGLMTAYTIGQYVPHAVLKKCFADLNLKRAYAYLDDIEKTPSEDRLAKQRDLLPGWFGKLTVDYRYATIGVLLNVPGTFAIGGGGGILMAAGLSRLFNGWVVLLTLMIATLPVPLLVWIMGVSIIGGSH